jgi:zinc transport system ATP-binding protein
LVKISNLSFAYGKHDIFYNLDFAVGADEFLLLAGDNGRGKTTLIKLILGILTGYKGEIKFNLVSIHQIGYLPQVLSADASFPITVLSVVLMGTLGHRLIDRYDSSDYQAAKLALKLVQMEDCENVPFGSLSGGLRQRVLIARSLTCCPRLLILDEPFSYLDTTSAKSLVDLLTKLKKDMAILIVSHSYKIISPLITRVFNLSAGTAWMNY